MSDPALKQEYPNLKPWNLQDGIIYGPISSRRFGRTLGINLLGPNEKVCSFNCVYCELGESKVRMRELKKYNKFPSLLEIDKNVRDSFRQLRDDRIKVDNIVISGNGEPTLYPKFYEAMSNITEARDDILSETPIIVLSNGTHIDNRRVQAGLNLASQRVIKFDAGNEKALKAINSPLVRATISKIIIGCRGLDNFIVQSCFVKGAIDNTTKETLEDWIEVIGLLHPKEVHLYSLDRIPRVSKLEQLQEEDLLRISIKLEKKTGIKAKVIV